MCYIFNMLIVWIVYMYVNQHILRLCFLIQTAQFERMWYTFCSFRVLAKSRNAQSLL